MAKARKVAKYARLATNAFLVVVVHMRGLYGFNARFSRSVCAEATYDGGCSWRTEEQEEEGQGGGRSKDEE